MVFIPNLSIAAATAIESCVDCLCCLIFTVKDVGRVSSVGIASRYGLDGPGIESQWWTDFSAPIQTGPGAHPAPYTMGAGSFPVL
jgi:hypothetical protein